MTDVTGARVEDRRHQRRDRVLRRARIVFNRGYTSFDCVVVDLSPMGARLRTGPMLGMPDRFELRIEHGRNYIAQVRYRIADLTGVSLEPA